MQRHLYTNVLLLIIASVLISGCETPYGSKLDDLYHQRYTGQITEAEYRAELKKLREEQPGYASPEIYQDNLKFRGSTSFP